MKILMYEETSFASFGKKATETKEFIFSIGLSAFVFTFFVSGLFFACVELFMTYVFAEISERILYWEYHKMYNKEESNKDLLGFKNDK